MGGQEEKEKMGKWGYVLKWKGGEREKQRENSCSKKVDWFVLLYDWGIKS